MILYVSILHSLKSSYPLKFFYNGSKKSNEIGTTSGCLILIGFAALVYFFTLIDSIDDLSDYWIQIVLVLLMGISLLVPLFVKKAKLTNRHITIENGYFKMENVGVALEEVQLDFYTKNEEFSRYHIRDTQGKIAIYSVFKDDLLLYFQEELSHQIHSIEEMSHQHNGASIFVQGHPQSIHYSLASGKYTLNPNKQTEISFVPELYAYDGKYKKAVPLTKK